MNIKYLSRGAGVIAIFVGCTVLVGWIFDIAILKSVFPGLPNMAANAAIAFVLGGVSVLFFGENIKDQRLHRIAYLCALAIAIIGLLTIFEYLFGSDFGIDQILFKGPNAPTGFPPGRMSLPTASNFLILGLALLFFNLDIRGHRPAQFLALVGTLIALIALIGYAYGVPSFYGTASTGKMALHTSLTFIALSLGILFTRTDSGLSATITSDSAGGVMARRLLLASVFVPSVMGWIRLQGERMGLYGFEFGLTLFAISNIVVFTIVVLWNANSLNRTDAERKRAEEMLLKSEKRMRSTLDSMLEGCQIIGSDWRYLYVNDALAKQGHAAKEELIGRTMMEVYPGIDNTDMFSNLRDCMENRISKHLENEFTFPDGSKGWFELSIEPVPEGIFILSIDITERKRAEEALRASESQLSLVYQNVSDVIFYLGVEPDERFRFISVNPAFTKTTGVSGSQAMGKLVQEVIPEPSFSSVVLPNYKKALHEKKTVQWEEVSAYPKGTKHGIVAVTPIFDANGRCTNLVGAVHDITEVKEAEEEVRRLNAELEQRVLERTAQLEAANKELETFSYSVSHDLRAPLRSIDGFSQALLEDYAERVDEQGKDYLRRVRAASQNMGQLIDDMLMLSRVTRSEMYYDTVNLSALAQSIATELRKSQPERQVNFDITPEVFVKGDARLLRVALENLLSNAWKFTSKHTQAKIEFGVTQKDGKNAVFVRDNGAGFDMAYANKLFIPFQRLHAHTEYPGTGIGLATVQRIIHRHGGHVWAEGEVDKGATFYLELNEIK